MSEREKELESFGNDAVKGELVKEAIAAATKDQGSYESNRIVLAGFMNFNELANWLSSECHMDFSEGIKTIHEEWQKKRVYMDTTIFTADPYIVPDDMIVDIDADLTEKLKPIKEKVKAFPPYHELPFDLKMVRIDHLMALQYHIDVDHVSRLSKKIKPGMNNEELIDFCLNFSDQEIPLKKQYITSSQHQGVAVFTTENNDVRIRGVEYRDVFIVEKDGKPLADTKAKAMVIIASLGDPFPMAYRFPNSINVDNSIVNRTLTVLNNGFHRAYALFKAGYTHMPCVFSDLSSNQVPTYLSNWQTRLTTAQTYKRPPLMKDFINSNLIIMAEAPIRKRLIKFGWNVEILPIFD